MSITIRDVFEAMPTRFQPEAAGDWNADVQFKFSTDGGGENWILSVHDGKCEIAEGDHDSPTATVETAAETWIGMVSGDIDGMAAFMTGKIKVSGNMGDLMRLQNPNLFKR